MDLSAYEKRPLGKNVNKNLIPKNIMTFDRVEEFNAIYRWARENLRKVEPTPSGGMPNNYKVKRRSRFIVLEGNGKFEMVIVCSQGQFRFILQPAKGKDNTITGQKACREFYKVADKLKIDLSKYSLSSSQGKEVKETIVNPHIEVLTFAALRCAIPHVHHIDFRSSYASRIIENYPELRPLYEEIYKMRSEKDGLYKHVLTNSIGAFQSRHCVNYFDRRTVRPFQFAGLSRVAINGTRKKVDAMIERLRMAGMVPIMTNTDGIWYYSKNGPYHGDGEGKDLCQWHNDHIDTKFLMASVGAYQYIEDGVCHTVLRGISNLDKLKPNREEWEFGDILKAGRSYVYVLDEEKGVMLKNG